MEAHYSDKIMGIFALQKRKCLDCTKEYMIVKSFISNTFKLDQDAIDVIEHLNSHFLKKRNSAANFPVNRKLDVEENIYEE